MRPDDDAAKYVLRRSTSAAPGTPCPDGQTLAGLAEGRLPAEQRAVLEPHVAACDECRGVVAAVAEEIAGPVATSAWRERLRNRWVQVGAAAALVIVAVSASLLRSRERAEGTETSLASAARALAAERPDLFAGFRPLDGTERAAGGAEVERGGIVLRTPVGTIAEERPTFSWSPRPGASVYDVALVAEDGREVWRRTAEGTSLPWPSGVREGASPGATYVWEVTTSDALGRAEGRRTFRVATASEKTSLEEARGEIDHRVPDPLRHLVFAHLAIRRDRLDTAERAVRAFLAARPDDPVGRETLDHLLRRIGGR